VPKVVIDGNGTGAKAQAFISSGKVTGIKIIDKGKGYTQTPTVTLVGGNGASTDIAKAVAYLGEGNARSFELKVKFDRINKEGLFSTFVDSQTFTLCSYC
jgi:ACT domain-containing protein